MGKRKTNEGNTAKLQPYSRTLNKARMAAIMGGVGLLFVAIARFFLPPQWLQISLMLFLVGIASALLTVGGTYRGSCPHCGADTTYAHAFGMRSFGCSKCSKRIAVHKTLDGVTFRRG